MLAAKPRLLRHERVQRLSSSLNASTRSEVSCLVLHLARTFAKTKFILGLVRAAEMSCNPSFGGQCVPCLFSRTFPIQNPRTRGARHWERNPREGDRRPRWVVRRDLRSVSSFVSRCDGMPAASPQLTSCSTRAADKAGIQFHVLNKSKGPAVYVR